MIACALVGTLTLLPYIFGLTGRLLGSHWRGKSLQRREVLLQRAATEEVKRTPPLLDEEWEKVDSDRATAPSTPPAPQPVQEDGSFQGVIGFFHPFCNAGGGGERVLFAAILATQRKYPRALCVIYTGDHDASKEQILANAKARFNISLNPARVCCLYLTTRSWVLASTWPYFTLLGQSLGSLMLGCDAFQLLAPDIFVDTMGYAFVLRLCKWLFPAVPTGAYVHYPTISTDMLNSLHDETEGRGLNAGSGKGFKGLAKRIYWQFFAKLYSWVGSSIDVVMTNSTWTQRHITSLWGGGKGETLIVYPPCAVEELQHKIPVTPESEELRKCNLVYIAQFRPEKMHHVIIDAFNLFLSSNRDLAKRLNPQLVLVGSVRDDHDEKRVYRLRLQAQEIKKNVKFVINAKWEQILDALKTSTVGVNGMWNEHFGIGVVEYQAAGLIAVVNDSGGPKEDIVIEVDGKPTGFRATTPEEFADGFAQALNLGSDETLAMRIRARKNSWRFSEQVFAEAWTRRMEQLVDRARK
ncbi:glycosyltransferase family 4 protein [Piedraia hortae CBS 480.64]|uniref:GDP-Man:Man(3)GlcNAc(2)-PP-Dol alpha-1,2-mannosyltransferase n=1 Tax=Piedraia hortae CBS 480.64 TaxID=1314780 RepID=A0A6A7C9X0_9PEZI|nr:glycosyltransferase family 4 protein [Piedraia hortae CBS 480.64]